MLTPLKRGGLLLAPVLCAAACAGRCGALGGLPPERPPVIKGRDGQTYYLVARGPYQAFYDRWGRLQRLEYDQNGDGRPDHVAHHDGSRTPRTIEIDDDYDGVFDRWEDYDPSGHLVKVGASRRGHGPDVWRVLGADGRTLRKEYDEDGDGRPDRFETFGPGGEVVGVEIDQDRDGRPDRWQTWRQGRLVEEEIDTDGDGKPDRRLRYGEKGNVLGLERIAAR